VLVHVVDAFPIDESDPIENYHLIENELKLYSEEIWQRPRVIALNKIDIIPAGEFGAVRQRFEELGVPMFPISAATGEGIQPFLFEVFTLLQSTMAEPEIPTLMPALEKELDQEWSVEKGEDGFEVKGRRVLRLVSMTNLENDEAVRYLHRRLQRLGVIEKLREIGAEEGDTVYVGTAVFAFTDQL